MDKWQKDHIRENLVELLESTTCCTKLNAYLFSREIISQNDKEKIEAKGETASIDAASKLYDIIISRKNGYAIMMKALLSCQQLGSYEIFMKGISKHALPEIRISSGGKSLQLKQLLNEQIVETIEESIGHNESYIDFCLDALKTRTPISLVNSALPQKTSTAESRLLARRAAVNRDIFGRGYRDVFVLTGTGREGEALLGARIKRNLSLPDEIVNSDDYLYDPRETSGAKYISLIVDQDWHRICQNADAPVHLINYIEADNTCMLNRTFGSSKKLRKFLSDQNEKYIKIAEETFVENYEISQSLHTVFICNNPKLNRTDFLISQAKNVETNQLEVFVSFINLKCLFKSHISSVSFWQLLDFISPTHMTQMLLDALIKRESQTPEMKSLKLILCFDSYYSLDLRDKARANTLFTDISNENKNLCIWVTAEKGDQSTLEEIFDVLSYEIHPEPLPDRFIEFTKIENSPSCSHFEETTNPTEENVEHTTSLSIHDKIDQVHNKVDALQLQIVSQHSQVTDCIERLVKENQEINLSVRNTQKLIIQTRGHVFNRSISKS